MSRLSRVIGSAKRIAPLAWPVFVGQVAVLAFSTVDTMMAARAGATDLAALAIGGAAYITVFIGLMGIVLAVSPIAGQLYGAQHYEACGAQLHQAMWLALALSVPGCLLLLFPQPFLDLARASPEVAAKVRGHLAALAVALPPALLFTAFRGFNTAVSRPKIVMALQLGALLAKVPLTALFVFGAGALPGFGAPGCGMATALCMLGQLAAVWLILRRDPFYQRFHIGDRFSSPHRGSLLALLRLGIPMGGSIMIEVTGFTFMAFFISRIGATPVAGHQIALNLVSLMFMMPMAMASATGTLVAQGIGARRHVGCRGRLRSGRARALGPRPRDARPRRGPSGGRLRPHGRRADGPERRRAGERLPPHNRRADRAERRRAGERAHSARGHPAGGAAPNP